MTPRTIAFQLQPKDLEVLCGYILRKRSRRHRLVPYSLLLLAVVILGMGLVQFLRSGYDRSEVGDLLLFVALFGAFMILQRRELINPAVLAKDLGSTLFQPQALELKDTGLLHTQGEESVLHEWHEISTVEDCGELVVLQLRSKAFIPIPRRDLGGEAAARAFLETLAERMN